MDRLQAMATFIRVVDTGSFSAAARQLRIGQPAVSKTIAQLEDRLQVRLLVRSSHALSPTDAGLRFYERARLAIQEVDEAELEARGAGAGLSGRLRVSAATTFARLMIIPRLPEFLAKHPSLDIDVLLDDRVIDLVAEGIDIALRMGTLSDSTAVARKLATGRQVRGRHPRLPCPDWPTQNAGRSGPPPCPGLQPTRRHLVVPKRQRRDDSDRARTRSPQRGGRHPSSSSGGHGAGRDLGLDVRTRISERRCSARVAGLDPPDHRFMGCLPDGQACQRKGPRLCRICREHSERLNRHLQSGDWPG